MALKRRHIQKLGAALSRRDWQATEAAYNELRDEFDRPLASPSAEAAQPVAWFDPEGFMASRTDGIGPGLKGSPASQPQGELREALDALANHKNWELDWGPRDRSDEEGDYGWRVHKQTGSVNDREWTLIGFGESPREALEAALAGRTAG